MGARRKRRGEIMKIDEEGRTRYVERERWCTKEGRQGKREDIL